MQESCWEEARKITCQFTFGDVARNQMAKEALGLEHKAKGAEEVAWNGKRQHLFVLLV